MPRTRPPGPLRRLVQKEVNHHFATLKEAEYYWQGGGLTFMPSKRGNPNWGRSGLFPPAMGVRNAREKFTPDTRSKRRLGSVAQMVRGEQESILRPRMAAQSLEHFRKFRRHRHRLILEPSVPPFWLGLRPVAQRWDGNHELWTASTERQFLSGGMGKDRKIQIQTQSLC